MGLWDQAKGYVKEHTPSSLKEGALLSIGGPGLLDMSRSAKNIISPPPFVPNPGPNQEQSMNQFMDTAQAARKKAMAEGETRGNELFGTNSLGRLDANRSAAMGSLIGQLQSKSQGWSDPEAAARKEMAMRGIQSQLATNLRAGRANAGSSGLRGAIANAQGAQAQKNAQQARGVAEQGLMVSGEEAARQGLQNYYTGLSGQEGAENQKRQYNLDQASKEKMGQLATQLGYGSLAAGDVASAGQNYAGQMQANAANNYAASQSQPGLLSRLGSGFFDSLFGGIK